jgi:hypothetical protein
MNRFKNIILFLVALAFTFNSFGFIIYFLIEIENTKEEAFEKIDESRESGIIETISVTISLIESRIDIERVNSREIRYRGKMYDLVKEERNADIITFYCIHDEKEDKLEKEFSNNLQKNINHKSVTNAQIQFNHQIQIADEGEEIAFVSPSRKASYSSFFNSNYFLNITKILTPPPKSDLS